nr:microtubule-associated protein 70-1-like [Ipomoea trifida]GLL37979.1 microtubule-associated protein 70-1-like [Ipomoea trifida]GLL38121.1 microtubule-associated protein 70-1-like [Ipomoea trifida]GLL39635.1 microtubule-associated protein 70-1-like [Ipomoea trifida]
MAEVPGERSVTATEVSSGENGGNVRPATAEATPLQLTVSASFKEGKTAMRRALVRSSLDADEFINLLHGSDRVKVKLNRLDNEVRDKNRESFEAQAEIKALRFSGRLREKAVEEVEFAYILDSLGFNVKVGYQGSTLKIRVPFTRQAADRNGLDAIELGVPYSDPLADGPVIQNDLVINEISEDDANDFSDQIRYAEAEGCET